MRRSPCSPAQQLGSVSARSWPPTHFSHDRRPPTKWPTSARLQRRSSQYRAAASPSRRDDSVPIRDQRLADLEAVLFLAREPFHARKLGQYANLADGTEARTLILRLNQMYDQEGRAFRVVEVAGGWQLRTRSQFARWLRRLPHTPAELRLSAPAMETLAVIAYRQPVVRADVETVRGVSCGDIKTPWFHACGRPTR